MHQATQIATRGILGLGLRRRPKTPVHSFHAGLQPPCPLLAQSLVTPPVGWQDEPCGWRVSGREEVCRTLSGLLPAPSQPGVFLQRAQGGAPPPPQGRAVCCSCGRCSWACWPAIVLWEPRAPAAREFWANAQPWHGPPLSPTPPVRVTTTDAGNICPELIHSVTATEGQPLPPPAPDPLLSDFDLTKRKIRFFPSLPCY